MESTKVWSRLISVRAAFCMVLMLLAQWVLIAISNLQPDSGQLLFWSRRTGNYALYSVDPARLLTVRLVEPPPFLLVDIPRFSRDAGRIAFETVHEGKLNVFVQDTRLHTLYTSDADREDRLPSLSPDGQSLALWSAAWTPYATNSRFQNWKLYIFDLEGATVRQLTTQLAVLPYENPFWSPDGARFVVRFWRGGIDQGTFVVETATGDMRPLPDQVDNGSDLVWSPDSEQIAFRSARERNSEVYVVDVNSGIIRNLTQHSASDFQPAWSPDQHRIAFTSTRDGRGNIYLINIDGTGLRQVTDRGGWQPVWSPHGDQIAFHSRYDGREALYVIDADGSNLRFIAYITEQNTFLGWYPQ